MYKLSPDVVENIKKKFPDSPIEKIIQYMFMEIVEKSITDGSCYIREFGKFVAFQTYSTKKKRTVIRFKFRPSVALLNKLNNDDYLLENIPVKSQIPFTEEHEQMCSQTNKELNLAAANEAEKLGKTKSIENLNRQDILDLLDKPS